MKIDACYNWPTCSDSAVARAVVLMQDGKAVRDDLHGKRPDCPVFVKDGDACDLNRWKARREWRAVLAAGRPAHFRARPVAHRPDAAERRHPRRSPHPLAAIGRDPVRPGLALRRPQRRHRQGLLLQLRPRHPPDPDRRFRLRRRYRHRRRIAHRPWRRRLWPALGPVARPRRAAPGSPSSSPASMPTRRARAAAPSGPPKRLPSPAPTRCFGLSPEPAPAEAAVAAAAVPGTPRWPGSPSRPGMSASPAGAAAAGAAGGGGGGRNFRRGKIVDQAGEDAVRAEFAADLVKTDVVLDLAAVEVAVLQADVEMGEHRRTNAADDLPRKIAVADRVAFGRRVRTFGAARRFRRPRQGRS